MKHDINLLSAIIGSTGAALKGMKKKHKFRMIVVNIIVGGLLAFLSMDIIPLFVTNASDKTIMLVSFSIGYVANELTDNMEVLVDSFFDMLKNKFKSSEKPK